MHHLWVMSATPQSWHGAACAFTKSCTVPRKSRKQSAGSVYTNLGRSSWTVAVLLLFCLYS